MINDFTDRNPRLSGVIIVVLFTLVPTLFFIITNIVFRGELNTAKILIVYALLLQAVLSIKVERMSLVILPFIVMIFAVFLCEAIYLVSVGLKPPGAGPDAVAYMFSSVIAAVFGPEMIGIVTALIGGAIISVIKELVT